MAPQRIEFALDPVHPLLGALGRRLPDAAVRLLEGLGELLLHLPGVPHYVGVEVALHAHGAVGEPRLVPQTPAPAPPPCTRELTVVPYRSVQ
jgi:hypothetical protein